MFFRNSGILKVSPPKIALTGQHYFQISASFFRDFPRI